MTETDDLKKLPPDERIKKLKALEEEKRKEIEEAQQLLKESAVELEREEKIKQEVPVPQMKAVDIGQLFTQEEKQVFATKRYAPVEHHEEEPEVKPNEPEKTLEDEVQVSDFKLTDEQMHEQHAYGEQLASEQPSQLYNLAKDAYDQFKETGQIDQGTVYALDVATRAKEEATGGEYKAASERAQEQFGSAKSIVKYLRGNI